MQNRLRDFLHYQVVHWLALLRWDAFNSTLLFLRYLQLHIMFPNLHRHLVQCPPTLHRYVEQTPGKFVGDTKCEKVRMLHSLRAKIFKFKSPSSDLKMAEINLLTGSLSCPRFLLRCVVKGVSPRRRLKSEVLLFLVMPLCLCAFVPLSLCAFEPLCLCAFAPRCLWPFVPLCPEHYQKFFSSLFVPDKRTTDFIRISSTLIMLCSLWDSNISCMSQTKMI